MRACGGGSGRKGADLDVLGEVLVFHGEVHGALETLDAGVDHLGGEPPERLLDVEVEVGIVQVVIPQPYGSGINHTAIQIKKNKNNGDGIARSSPGSDPPGMDRPDCSPYFLRREEMACM